MAVAGLIHLLIVLLIIGAILGVVWWAINQIAMPPPVRMIVILVFVLIVLIVCLDLLLPMLGTGPLLR